MNPTMQWLVVVAARSFAAPDAPAIAQDNSLSESGEVKPAGTVHTGWSADGGDSRPAQSEPPRRRG